MHENLIPRRPDEYSIEPVMEKEAKGSEHIQRLLDLAIARVPELAKTQLRRFSPENDFDAGGYYDFETDADGLPRPTINISEGDAELLLPLLAIRKHSIEQNAQLLGILVEKVTLTLLQLFIIAHELGHIADYEKNYRADETLSGWEAVDEMDFQREMAMGMLPIPNTDPTKLAGLVYGIHSLEDVKRLFPKNNIENTEGISTIDDLLRAQEIAYRATPMEEYADRFAAKMLREHAKAFGIEDLFEDG